MQEAMRMCCLFFKLKKEEKKDVRHRKNYY